MKRLFSAGKSEVTEGANHRDLSAWHNILCALCALCGFISSSRANTLEQGFRDVPMAERPWCYYWWVNGNVDAETITRDLEAMRRVGFGGLLLLGLAPLLAMAGATGVTMVLNFLGFSRLVFRNPS